MRRRRNNAFEHELTAREFLTNVTFSIFTTFCLLSSDICENSSSWKTSTIFLWVENNRIEGKNSCVKLFYLTFTFIHNILSPPFSLPPLKSSVVKIQTHISLDLNIRIIFLFFLRCISTETCCTVSRILKRKKKASWWCNFSTFLEKFPA